MLFFMMQSPLFSLLSIFHELSFKFLRWRRNCFGVAQRAGNSDNSHPSTCFVSFKTIVLITIIIRSSLLITEE